MCRYIGSILLAAVLAIGPVAGSAQQVGPLVVGASSGNAELPAPAGWGAFGQLEAGAWRVRLAYVRYSDETEKGGVVCTVYSPRIGCRSEGVSTAARLGGLRIAVERAVSLGGMLEVALGGGLSFSSVAASSVGATGSAADLHVPNSGNVGYLGGATVALMPLATLPVKVVAGFSNHWVKFKGCVDPTDPTSGYAPFCGWERFREVQVGLSVILPRQE